MTQNLKYLITARRATIAGIVVCVLAPTSTSAQLAEQRVTSARDAEAQNAAYLSGLASALKAEKRDNTWAPRKESELWMSYVAEKDLPRGGLKTVECRTSRCELQFQANTNDAPSMAVQNEIAVDYWIARQSCGYTRTITPGSAQAPEAIQIFLDCSK